MITLTEDGEERFFRDALSRLWVSVQLFVNDRTPRHKASSDDFVELNGHAYSPVLVTPENWLFRKTRRNHLIAQASAEWTFAQGPRQVVHGYFVTSQSDHDVVLWADRLDQPVVLLNNGEHLAITMQLSPFRRRATDAARSA